MCPADDTSTAEKARSQRERYAAAWRQFRLRWGVLLLAGLSGGLLTAWLRVTYGTSLGMVPWVGGTFAAFFWLVSLRCPRCGLLLMMFGKPFEFWQGRCPHCGIRVGSLEP